MHIPPDTPRAADGLRCALQRIYTPLTLTHAAFHCFTGFAAAPMTCMAPWQFYTHTPRQTGGRPDELHGALAVLHTHTHRASLGPPLMGGDGRKTTLNVPLPRGEV